jgi:hypothetical protein
MNEIQTKSTSNIYILPRGIDRYMTKYDKNSLNIYRR